jgi:cell division septal protein FtsQ
MRIQSKKSWQKHIPGRAQRAPRDYYSGKNKKNKIRLKQIIFFILILLLVQSIFQVKVFRLNDVELINNEDLELASVQELIDEHLDQRRYLIFKNNNYFLFDETALSEDLMTEYNLDQANIVKKFPHTIQIDVQEKISQFIWQKDDTLYLLSSKGALNRQIAEKDEKYLILQDFRDIRPSGEQILSENELSIINNIYLNWQSTFTGEPILQTIILSDDLSTVEAQVRIGYKVKIDANKYIIEQLNNLKKVLAGNVIGLDIDYIDLRFGDRVFFK